MTRKIEHLFCIRKNGRRIPESFRKTRREAIDWAEEKKFRRWAELQHEGFEFEKVRVGNAR